MNCAPTDAEDFGKQGTSGAFPFQQSMMSRSVGRFLVSYLLWCLGVTLATGLVMATAEPPGPPAIGKGDWVRGGLGLVRKDPVTGAPLCWYWNYCVQFGHTTVDGTILNEEMLKMQSWGTPLNPEREKLKSEQAARATRWSIVREAPGQSCGINSHLVEHAYGWPCRMFLARMYWNAGPAGTAPSPSGVFTFMPGQKEGRWLLSGIAYNALIGVGFSLALSTVGWRLWGSFRSRRLRVKGLCPNCGYAWGALTVCPECGQKP